MVLTACRLLASLLLGNYVCLVVLNAFRLPVWLTVPVYPVCVATIWLALRHAPVRRPRIRLPRWTWYAGGIFLALLTAPRLPYLLEWLPSRPAVLAQADDYGRLAELVAMTQSASYPLVHPGNQAYLLSHYYTALYPMAWLQLAIPVLTLKDAIVLGNLLYHTIMLLALREAACRLFHSTRRALVFLFLTTFFAGLDWLFYARFPFAHAEHWPRLVFNSLREVSSPYTALYWVIHHVSALACILLAGLFAREMRFPRRWQKILLMATLWLAAFFTSPFVTLGAVITWHRFVWRILVRLWRTRLWIPLGLTAMAPLPLMLGRVLKGSFFWDMLPGWQAPAYFTLVLVIDLGLLPLLLWRRRIALAGAWIMLVATVFIASIGYNNFCMRGMLAPTFAFFLAAAQHLAIPRPVILLPLIALFSIGTVREAAWLFYQPLEFSTWYWNVTGRPAPPEARRLIRDIYPRVARDRDLHYYAPDARDRIGLTKYNAERLVRDIPPEEMETPELELMRRPLLSAEKGRISPVP